MQTYRRPFALRAVFLFGETQEAATANRCGFCGPDTRQLLLPLLPFGPDGVGSAAAVRLGHIFTRKVGRLSMAEPHLAV